MRGRGKGNGPADQKEKWEGGGKENFFPCRFSNFIFKWFLNHFEFWIKTTQQNKRIAAA
jgi:hypothetical protein